MRNQLFNKRIPTIFAIGLITLGIVLTTVIVKMQTNLRSSAESSEEPQNIKITNLSDDSFTITYQTDLATIGSINYGKSKELGNAQLEDITKNVHSLTVDKLSPDTKYYLAIISGQNIFLNKGVPFEILTGPSIASPSSAKTVIKGKIILPDGNAPKEGLAYLSTNNSQLLSTTVTKEGEFNFSLKELRTDDLSSYLEVNKNSVLKLFAINDALTSTVLLSGEEAYLLPTITLSNDYDFTMDSVEIASRSAQSSFPSTVTESKNLKPQILTPKKEQALTDQKPQFRGTGLPNEVVEIIIHSDENIQTQVVADSNGNWTYRPPTNLSPGAHTITIKTRDSEGILTTLTQSFTVFAQGSQVLESATPSATPTPNITPTPTPTPTLFPSPTITPAFTPIPTSIIETSKGDLPPTGNSSILLIIGGIIATVVGLALFFLTRNISL